MHPDNKFKDAQKLDVVVAPIRSLMQPLLASLADLAPLALNVGDSIDLTAAVTKLVEIGYERVEMVERRGHIAVRGGILDVFVPGHEHPLRIEFFGDDVEEIRNFSVADQRSLDVAPNGLWAPACYEPFLNEEFEPKLKKLSRKQGQILVKLINRQTGKTTFDLIKDYKSGWKAFWSNNTAKLFNIDIKKTYDPMEVPEDYYIETYLQRCFDEGKLVKQEAKKPISK